MHLHHKSREPQNTNQQKDTCDLVLWSDNLHTASIIMRVVRFMNIQWLNMVKTLWQTFRLTDDREMENRQVKAIMVLLAAANKQPGVNSI